MVIKGQNLRIMVGEAGTGVQKCIAMATSCEFHVAAALGDVSTKDSEGDWQEQDITGLSWDASTDSLVTLEDNGINGELPTDLLSLIVNKTKLTLVFDVTAGANNRIGQNSAIKRQGQAYLTDYALSAPNRANSTLRCSFTGTGALVVVNNA